MNNIAKIKVEDIRINSLNHYSLSNIEELASSIEDIGQMENATVYYDESDDTKHYTLIGGERRFRAVSLLFENGKCDGTLMCNIIEKPIDKAEEFKLIISDNKQRIKTSEDVMQEVLVANTIYKELVTNGNRPSGLKRDWIGNFIGISGRQVQMYLKKITKGSEPKEETPLTLIDIKNTLLQGRRKLTKANRDLHSNDFEFRDVLALIGSIETLESELQRLIESMG